MTRTVLMTALSTAALLAGVLGWGSVAPLAAATVELVVAEPGGFPVSGRRVRLDPHAPDFPLSARRWRPGEGGQILDSDGRAVFEGVSPGDYEVVIDLEETSWIPPRENPLRPLPVFAVPAGEEVLPIQLEVFRGVPVHLLLDLPEPVSGFQARVRHLASGVEMRMPLRGDSQETTWLLPPGVWEVEVMPIQGFILVGVLVDRQEWMGASVVLDLLTDDLPPDLMFSFAAGAEIEGTVSATSLEWPVVTMRATLLDPGPWHAAALARGVEIPRRVDASLDRERRYRMYLPEGRWRVRPVGERLLGSTPEHLERRLAAGDVLLADFTVEMEPEGDRIRPLRARVFWRDRRRLDQALGAVFDDGVGPGEGAPLWTGRSRGEVLEAPGLPAGRYRLVAGHLDSLEGRLVVEHDPEQRPDRAAREMPELELPLGGAVGLVARDGAGARMAGVELGVERLDELPELLLTASEFLAAKRRRTLVSDLGGSGRATGFYGGRHRFEARVGGERRATGIVEVRASGGAWQRSLELDLAESGEVEIEARERPGSRLAARIDCGDDWKLPETVSVRLLDGGAPADEDPVLALEDQPLLGRRRDELVIGPLEAGSYLLGLRPEGFDRWTWAYGAATPAQAEGLLVEAGDRDSRRAVDLGELFVECGPAVDLLPRVATGAPFPSLWDVRMSARALSRATGEALKALALKRLEKRLELRDMPRGEQILEIRLEHSWFLPDPELTWRIPIELERGMYREIPIELEALGGAIAVRGLGAAGQGAAAAVRAVNGEATSAVVPARDGQALIPSLAPGTWRVELCPEAGCATQRPLREVEVVSGQTVVFDAGAFEITQ